MTPQEIIEGNVLLATFMDERKRNLELDDTKSGYHYHDDWNCLMKVVQKIWGITNCSDSIFYFTVGYKSYVMTENNTGKHIERCWLACLTFVKWYNQNKQK